jgi:hypothetical protein
MPAAPLLARLDLRVVALHQRRRLVATGTAVAVAAAVVINAVLVNG